MPPARTAALNACTLEAEILNSERIADQFGNCSIEVLSHSGNIRRSSLFSMEGNKPVCRTYAVVQFSDTAILDVADSHKAILAGESIGATFKATGWTISKATLYVGTLDIPGISESLTSLMHLDSTSSLSLHVYELILQKRDSALAYATIIEVHHPEYMTVAKLKKLYATDMPLAPGEPKLKQFRKLVLDTG